MLDLLQHYGIEPDDHVFSILMAGSKEKADLASIRRLLDIVIGRGCWTPYLVNDS